MEYEKAVAASVTIRRLSQKLNGGELNAVEMNKLAAEYGRIAGECISNKLYEEYPTGQILEEDVRRIVSPILKQNHKFISEITAKYQNRQYRNAGVGIKTIIPEYNSYRENELVKDISKRSFLTNGLER